MALFFSGRESPSPEQTGNNAAENNFSSGGHFLAQVLGDRDDSPSVQPPGRPNAPAPTPTPSMAMAPSRPKSPTAATFNLGPERPLKLFKLQDFEFLKVLGTSCLCEMRLIYSSFRNRYVWASPAGQI